MQYFLWLLWASYTAEQATAFYLSRNPTRSAQGNPHSINALLRRTSHEDAAGWENAKTSSMQLSIKRKAPPVRTTKVRLYGRTDDALLA